MLRRFCRIPFITCRLDYCNSLLCGVSNNLLQNAAARLITRTWRCEHISPVLQTLHWLPVRRRVEFKLTCLVHQSLAGQTPACLVSDIQLIADTGRHQLRSTSGRMCVVPRTHNNSFGDRSFSAAVPRVWNALPAVIFTIGHELQTLQAVTERTHV